MTSQLLAPAHQSQLPPQQVPAHQSHHTQLLLTRSAWFYQAEAAVTLLSHSKGASKDTAQTGR